MNIELRYVFVVCMQGVYVCMYASSSASKSFRDRIQYTSTCIRANKEVAQSVMFA